MKMIAEGKFKHNGKWLKRNDKFTTDAGNGEDLRAMGFASKDPEADGDAPEAEVEQVVEAAAPRRNFRQRSTKSEG